VGGGLGIGVLGVHSLSAYTHSGMRPLKCLKRQSAKVRRGIIQLDFPHLTLRQKPA